MTTTAKTTTTATITAAATTTVATTTVATTSTATTFAPYTPPVPADGPLYPANTADWQRKVVDLALRYQGVPYVWGGTTPAGWDCSGFVQWVFSNAVGVNLPRVTFDQVKVGANVGAGGLRAGDLVFFANTNEPGVSHVGIALGDDRFVHASGAGAATIVSSLGEPYYIAHYFGARRVVAGGSAQGGPSIPQPSAGPVPAPSQLLPTFARAAQLTGVPQEVLLAVARVESGFDPRAVGPYLPQFAGQEDQHALGMMQFLPSTYRPYAARIDAITGKGLGMQGIWDAESSIYAAAFYLKESGAPGDMRRALFAYNRADWYVNLILAWAGYYQGGVLPDPNMYRPDGSGRPIAAPDNALLPTSNQHFDLLSPIPLYAPFQAGQTWYVGGDGNFYGRDTHTDGGNAHYAVDFNKGTRQQPEGDEGQPVLAAADGIINNVYATAGGGWTVEMYHRSPDGLLLRSVYLHLKDDPRVSAGLKVNQAVPHGTTIGFVGNTGALTTGAHLHFALYLLRDQNWVSIRPEPMQGQMLQDGGSITSTNDPAVRAEFEQAWKVTDRAIYAGQQRTWLWGPQAVSSALIEGYAAGQDNTRLAQYYDKGRMESRRDEKGNFIVTAGRLGWELLTGKVDLGNGKTEDRGPAAIPMVGGTQDLNAPTYADAARFAAQRTIDYNGVPVAWKLLPGGEIVPVEAPAEVLLANYDPESGHNVADVFARWYDQTFFSADDVAALDDAMLRELGLTAEEYATLSARLGDEGGGRLSLSVAMREKVEGMGPGHPLTDPFWVEVSVDGRTRLILVQVFERWTLTYSPDNPEGWQIELGNVGTHYYNWRYEAAAQDAIANEPGKSQRRRRTNRKDAKKAAA